MTPLFESPAWLHGLVLAIVSGCILVLVVGDWLLGLVGRGGLCGCGLMCVCTIGVAVFGFLPLEYLRWCCLVVGCGLDCIFVVLREYYSVGSDYCTYYQ